MPSLGHLALPSSYFIQLTDIYLSYYLSLGFKKKEIKTGNKTVQQRTSKLGWLALWGPGILKAPLTLPRAALPLHQGNGPSVLLAPEVTFVISLVFGSSNKRMSNGPSKAVRQSGEHQGGTGPALPKLVS